MAGPSLQHLVSSAGPDEAAPGWKVPIGIAALIATVFGGAQLVTADEPPPIVTKDGTRLEQLFLQSRPDTGAWTVNVVGGSSAGQYCIETQHGSGSGGFCSSNWAMADRRSPPVTIGNLERSDPPAMTVDVMADPDRTPVLTSVNGRAVEPVDVDDLPGVQSTEVRIGGHLVKISTFAIDGRLDDDTSAVTIEYR